MDIAVKDLGTCNYSTALSKQELTREQLIQNGGKNTLFLVEHDHIYTLGKNANPKNILKDNCEIVQTDRGGDVTYHGPGQIMGYPIIDLDNFFTDINLYLRKLEEVIINTLKSYELNGFTIKGETGVWVNDHNGLSKKICAFGIRASRWVTMHGFCFNINPELNYFKNIIPCGIKDKGVTSVSELKNNIIKINEIKEVLYKNFAQSFEAELVYEN